ncbi:MAG: nucleotidyltransferase domain-containing protein [Chloroflexi bacterium]|nr:nucleotidyltransferase domain-containing protein [Chloroflexota bacterium]
MANEFTTVASQALGVQLTSAILFGSVARGQARRNSDIDLLIVVRADDEALSRLRERVTDLCLDFEDSPEMQSVVEMGFPAVIRQIVYSETEALRTHLFYLDLVTDGEILFDRDGFMAAKLARVRQKMVQLGTRREYLNRKRWIWLLKPGMQPGEVVEL